MGRSPSLQAERPVDDLVALDGAGLVVVACVSGMPPQAFAPGVVRVGVHRSGALPQVEQAGFDILLSVDPTAPRPWTHVPDGRLDGVIAELEDRVLAQPAAAAACAEVLRMGEHLPFDQALVAESHAYSMLLASQGFRDWRARTPVRRAPEGEATPRVAISQEDGALYLRLTRPEARNAFDARMRDALVEALEFALVHPDAPPVVLSGAGPAFSAGGDLDEFGRAADVGVAHLIRTLRSPARLARALNQRLTVRLHGACIGAGIELPAAAGRVVACDGAYFRLPEVGMGLIPGAGGTATLPRRIGRHRTCYMAISGADIDLPTALSWGLVDAVER